VPVSLLAQVGLTAAFAVGKQFPQPPRPTLGTRADRGRGRQLDEELANVLLSQRAELAGALVAGETAPGAVREGDVPRGMQPYPALFRRAVEVGPVHRH